jgi:hypothetical protein
LLPDHTAARLSLFFGELQRQAIFQKDCKWVLNRSGLWLLRGLSLDKMIHSLSSLLSK